MECHLLDSKMKLFASFEFCHGTGGFTLIGQRSAARIRPLRVAEIIFFHNPRRGRKQFEMRFYGHSQR
jgi:hypothetical protein